LADPRGNAASSKQKSGLSLACIVPKNVLQCRGKRAKWHKIGKWRSTVVSEKLRRVLKKYEIPEALNLSESEGWGLVRQREGASAQPKPSTSICFSGFTQSDAEDHRKEAENFGFAVTKSVAKSTTYLCCGPLGAGPSKVKKAESQGAKLISEKEFLQILETGELP